MRILLVGKDSHFNAEFFYRKAFTEIGNDIFFIDSYRGINNQLLSRIVHTRTNVFNHTLKNLWINKFILDKVKEIDPDIIIFFKGEMISDQVLKYLSENWNIYLFYPDTYKFKALLRRELEYFKIVYTASNNKTFYYNMGAKKVETIPWACDPDFHRKIEIPKKYEVSFIGTAYLERRRIIRRLNRVDVFGDYWYGFGKKSHSPVYGYDLIKTICESKINLNLQAKVSVLADAPTMRTFEVAGSGGFQISDYMPSLKRYFPMLPTFSSQKELKELISYYLENQEERNDIAAKCREICLKSFKYTDSAKIIINSINKETI